MGTRNLGDMIVRIVGDNVEFDKSIDRSEKKLDSFTGVCSKVGLALSAAITAPVLASGKAMLSASADMEMYEAGMKTMLGSTQAAKNMMASLADFAAKTPLELPGIVNATTKLLQYGIASEDIIPTLKTLGDVTLGNQGKFDALAYAYGQMSSAGKLMGQDLLQMINAGFNPLQIMAEKTGISVSELKKRIADGEITVNDVKEAFKIATTEGGRFFNGMENGSKTFTGLASTMNDDVRAMMRSFGDMLLPIAKDVAKEISKIAKNISDMEGPSKVAIITVATFASTLGPLALGIAGISKAFTFLAANPVTLVIGAIAALTAGILAYVAAQRQAQREVEKSWQYDETKTLAQNKERLEQIRKLTEQTMNERDQLDKNSRMWKAKNTIVEEGFALYKSLSAAIKDHEAIAEVEAKAEAERARIKKEAAGALTEAQRKQQDEEIEMAWEMRQQEEELATLQEGLYEKWRLREEEQRQIGEESLELKILRMQEETEAQVAALEEGAARVQKAAEDEQAVEDWAFQEKLRLMAEENEAQIIALNEGVKNLEDSKKKEELVEQESFEYKLWLMNKENEEQLDALNEGVRNLEDAKEKERTIIDDISNSWDEYFKDWKENIKDNAKDWTDIFGAIEDAAILLVGSGLEEIGETLVGQQADWGDYGNIALQALKGILESIGAQLAAMAALRFVMLDFVGGGIATAASAAAFVAAGAIGGVIQNIEDEKEAAIEAKKEMEQAAEDALEAETKAQEAAAKEAERIQKEALEAQEQAAEDAAKAQAKLDAPRLQYLEDMEQLQTRINVGLIDQSELLERQIDLAERYANSLIELGFDTSSAELQSVLATLSGLIAQLPTPVTGAEFGLKNAAFGDYVVGEDGPEVVKVPSGSQILNSIDSERYMEGMTQDSMLHLILNIDSELILDKIYQATRDRRVLVDSGAVVS